MPIVRVELFSGRTPEQKTACARDIVRAISQHLGVPHAATQVLFVDMERSDWLNGDKLLPETPKKE
jgi:4-oxalocrotonate tautomerase